MSEIVTLTAQRWAVPADTVGQSLTISEAYALAELCKRLSWSDCEKLSANVGELQLMIRATDKLRGFLADAGIEVR